ncbi:MAG TPA: DUF357 domain-containing protein [Candidatus Methanofastidiosa archaeon]|nr:DUF357 domain-containing protein [Candidatus Methanofastidiosa archaeon]HPR42112.1 DUF357 domain-containing protein [Candidatus Methanofastidiosa archaeon]
MMREDRITDDKLDHYFEVAKRALDEVEVIIPKGSHLELVAFDYLDMAKRYYSDADYYRKREDYVTAFASLNYLHGFLDAGARLGVFKVESTELFAFDNRG